MSSGSELEGDPMPHFYFDVFDGHRALYDEVGEAFATEAEAIDEAVALLPDFARETLPAQQSHSFGAVVRDGRGSVVYRAMLLFQGQRTQDHEMRQVTAVSNARRQVVRNTAIRAEATVLSDRLRQNVEGLLTTFEELKSKAAVSPAAVQGTPPTTA